MKASRISVPPRSRKPNGSLHPSRCRFTLNSPALMTVIIEWKFSKIAIESEWKKKGWREDTPRNKSRSEVSKRKSDRRQLKKKKKGGDDRNLKESCQVFSFSINRKWSTDLKKQKIFFVSKRTATVWASTTRNNSRLNRRKVRTPVTGCFYLSFV